MLALYDSARFGRRDFLRIGGLTLGGLSLPGLLAERATAANLGRLLRDKSVVFVFMHGGPSQVETFDPKMTAPPGIASVNGEVQTSLPGVTFGSSFPRLAGLADRMTIIRSFKTGDGNHDIKPIVGRHTSGANLGALYARVAGANRPQTGVPTNVALYPQAVDPSTMPAIKLFGDFEDTGGLGSGFAPFVPSEGGALKQNMTLNLPLARLEDRRSLLVGLDGLKRQYDSGVLGGHEGLRQQAYDTILGGVVGAFDLSQEDPRTIARYDTASLVRPDSIDTRWSNHQRYADNAKSLGKLMLLARRLCERGCGFVTVTTNFVWDMHADVNNATMEEGLRYMGGPFDHAISTFLEDVEERGLSDDILLICCGEMGRTPRLNANGGRDHWGNLAPLMLAGGGINTGQVIGRSNRDASEPATDPVTIPQLVASVMHALLDLGELRLRTDVPQEIIRAATSSDPIPGLW